MKELFLTFFLDHPNDVLLIIDRSNFSAQVRLYIALTSVPAWEAAAVVRMRFIPDAPSDSGVGDSGVRTDSGLGSSKFSVASCVRY